ncbi:uncharacterized protein DNG_05789 [Cephalotrichum gorgonifer]|uniref:Uncharacterized protein n=1 Tax=Cephalotrichum gorgonifer TaxID=2041049 RepID=A0AAE8SWK7_9PEZI|nr:uncharacterized protein DNG_05789 [Cephalotrichum gorgonifer]
MARQDARLTLNDSLELIPISLGPDTSVYMSTRAAWVPGGDLPWGDLPGDLPLPLHTATYGAHVYAMAGAAVLRSAAAARESAGVSGNGEGSSVLGLHTIQGCFTSRGLGDRPFLFTVTRISSGRSLATYSLTVRQPTTPSTAPSVRFPRSDASRPLGPVCFTALVTLKAPEPSPVRVQAPSPQTLHSSILSSRPPSSWPLCPQVDIDIVNAIFPDQGQGRFPILDMRKVDMTEYNSARPPTGRKEILLYRLLEPTGGGAGEEDGKGEEELGNEHILAHAFAADRNGLLMLCRDFDFGWSPGAVATVSWSFYVHVNASEAVMRRSGGRGRVAGNYAGSGAAGTGAGVASDGDGEDDGWWVLEDSFERAEAGRGFMVGRIFSPEGVHVATAVQDGIARALAEMSEGGRESGKEKKGRL